MRKKLAEELRALREVKGKSLREVENETQISNAYLSQLERGVAENPSPHVLHKLAEYYDAPYESLMVAAGYVNANRLSNTGGTPSSLEILLKSAKLTDDEQEQVKKYVRFLKSQHPR